MATGGQYDFFTDPILFDDSYDWTFWSGSGMQNIIFNFQKSVSEKVSIRPFVGHTLNRFTLFYRPENNVQYIHDYTTTYLNYGAFANYHFNKKMTGLKLSLGPRIYSKTSQSLLRLYLSLIHI